MIPGTALGVVAGDLVYTWLAFRLARRSGRGDVTAMPLGLDTPSTIAVGTLILLPSLKYGMEQHGYDHGQAMVFAWHVGAVLLVMIGICKSIVAPLGTAVRRWVPRAGLLGSLAGIALALIALVPLWQHIAAVPLVGLVTLIADPRDPRRAPSPARPNPRGLGGGSPGRGPLLVLRLAGHGPGRAAGCSARTSTGGGLEAAGILPRLCPKLVLVAAGVRPCRGRSCP